jgi:hypothetical protein
VARHELRDDNEGHGRGSVRRPLGAEVVEIREEKATRIRRGTPPGSQVRPRQRVKPAARCIPRSYASGEEPPGSAVLAGLALRVVGRGDLAVALWRACRF